MISAKPTRTNSCHDDADLRHLSGEELCLTLKHMVEYIRWEERERVYKHGIVCYQAVPEALRQVHLLEVVVWLGDSSNEICSTVHHMTVLQVLALTR